ncbi:donson [Acrasis kona]|uniref:Donson n=1 Tax=Acrasis kona TaxID=1008807 RepID=A0AAW2ZDV5_9EUKA
MTSKRKRDNQDVGTKSGLQTKSTSEEDGDSHTDDDSQDALVSNKKPKKISSAIISKQKHQDNILLNKASLEEDANSKKSTKNLLDKVLRTTNVKKVESSVAESDQLNNIYIEDIPMDWSIKTKITIESKEPFGWSTSLSSLAQSTGLSSYVMGQKIDASSYTDTRSNTQQADLSFDFCAGFVKYCMNFMSPSMPLPPSIKSKFEKMDLTKVDEYASVDSFRNELGEDFEYLKQRLTQWASAFQSVYTMLRNGDCPYFYLITKGCPIIFIGCRVNEVEQIRVVISKVSQKMKEEIVREKIKFQIIQEHTLLFVGFRRVHAIFDFLLQYNMKKCLVRDVPIILSPVSFLFGTLTSLSVHDNAYNKYDDRTKQNTTVHKLELDGFILPHSWYPMLLILQHTQKGDFHLRFKQVVENTHLINSTQRYDYSNSQMTQYTATQQGGGNWTSHFDETEYSYLNKKESKVVIVNSVTCTGNVYTKVELNNLNKIKF